ncbi:MAG: carbohydrate kinase [Desulfosudaceae bacterium]
MIIAFGEILFDVFPEYKRLGGAPFNFAYHLKRLGWPVRFLSRVGDDAHGREIIQYVRRYGLDPADIQVDPDHPTGYVSVSLKAEGVPEFNIVPNVAYDHIEITGSMPDFRQNPPDLFYFGTLAQRYQTSAETIQRIFEQKDRSTTFFYDVNLRPDCYTWSTIETSLRHTDILKLNEEELTALRDMSGLSETVPAFIDYLIAEYELTLLALTRGSSGSALYTPTSVLETGADVPKNNVDTVGAGDAFAAVLASGYLSGRPLRQTLEAASAFAADICTIAGAIPEDPDFYNQTRNRLQSTRSDNH